MKQYWIDHKPVRVEGFGLGKIRYSHVHENGTVHPTNLTTPPAHVAWVGTPGMYSPAIRVQCRTCDAILQPDDRIEVEK